MGGGGGGGGSCPNVPFIFSSIVGPQKVCSRIICSKHGLNIERFPLIYNSFYSLLSNRIDDTIQKLKMQQDDKLQKWHEGLGEVNGWVMKTRVKVEAQTRLATDVEAALEQIDDFQVCCCCCCCCCCCLNVSSLKNLAMMR